LLAPRPTPKLEDHPSSAVRGCLFSLFTATLRIGDRSSIRNLRTRHSVVTGTHIHVDVITRDAILNDTNTASCSRPSFTTLLHGFFNSTTILHFSCMNFFVLHKNLLERSSGEADGINSIVSETRSDLPYRGQSWE
jgi:hypothetical protein